MKVQVTIKDINDGVMCSSALCPVALAILHTVKGKYCVRVKNDHIALFEPNIFLKEPFQVAMPEAVKKFIRMFDKLGVGEPFEFDLPFSE